MDALDSIVNKWALHGENQTFADLWHFYDSLHNFLQLNVDFEKSGPKYSFLSGKLIPLHPLDR